MPRLTANTVQDDAMIRASIRKAQLSQSQSPRRQEGHPTVRGGGATRAWKSQDDLDTVSIRPRIVAAQQRE
jgi:hypothetical protein